MADSDPLLPFEQHRRTPALHRFQSLGSRRQIHADRHNPVNQMFEPANQRIVHTSQSDSTNFP
ncbi:MAG: hypothetical protein LT082_03305 [Comamonas sp.]|nr:hypothetical protein [Comamonas sp.]